MKVASLARSPPHRALYTALMSEEHRVALVVGGAGGAGLAVAGRLKQGGLRVALLDQPTPQAQQVAESGDFVFIGADLSQPDAAERAIRELLWVYGRLDVLIFGPDTLPDAGRQLFGQAQSVLGASGQGRLVSLLDDGANPAGDPPPERWPGLTVNTVRAPLAHAPARHDDDSAGWAVPGAVLTLDDVAGVVAFLVSPAAWPVHGAVLKLSGPGEKTGYEL